MVYYIEFDIAAIVLYIVLITAFFARKHFKDRLSIIYVSIMIVSLLAAICDILSAIGINRHFSAPFVIATTGLYYIFLSGITFCFLSYVVYQLETDARMSNLAKHLFRLPIIYYTLLVLTNGVTGWIFSYSIEDRYKKGPLQPFVYTIAAAYLIGTVCYIVYKRKVIDKKLRFAVYNISVVNLIFVVVQSFFPEHMIICFGAAVSMVILSMSSNNREVQIDQVTGMMNRDHMAMLLEKKFYNEEDFTAIFIRIADYDQLSNIYGIQITDVLVRNIGKELTEFVGIGKAFQTNTSTFVLIYDNGTKVKEDIRTIDLKLSSSWDVEGQVIPFSYLITHVSVPLRAKSKDAFIACLTYFEKMKRMRYGIVPPEELAVRDKVRETVVERAILEGLADGNLSVFYQPICSAGDVKFVSAEALVRLKDPELGFISPSEFIPVAEKSGLMIEVGNFVFDNVCRFLAESDICKNGVEYVEVNLSVVQCLQRDFMNFVDETIEKYDISPSRICFEITETAANCSPEVFTNNLSELVQRGFKLAIDDFGSGYGNLERMVTSSFSIIKFDKKMTERMCSNEQMRTAFKRMVTLFKMLDLEIVSEGVETEEQYNFLNAAGVDYIQGYYFAKPMTENSYIKFVEENMN